MFQKTGCSKIWNVAEFQISQKKLDVPEFWLFLKRFIIVFIILNISLLD